MKITFFKILILSIVSTGFFCTNSFAGNTFSLLNEGVPTVKTGNSINKDKPVINIYNFHLKRRCVNCLAIEKAVNQTLEKHFQKEVAAGLIKMNVINVEEDANKKIVEKFEVYGMGLYIVRTYKGKETIIDLTGDGVKYAKNKPEKFIKILKGKISENLK